MIFFFSLCKTVVTLLLSLTGLLTNNGSRCMTRGRFRDTGRSSESKSERERETGREKRASCVRRIFRESKRITGPR